MRDSRLFGYELMKLFMDNSVISLYSMAWPQFIKGRGVAAEPHLAGKSLHKNVCKLDLSVA